MGTSFTAYERDGAQGPGKVYEVDLADGETSEALPVQPRKSISLTVAPAEGATGKAQVTTVPPDEVDTATAWEDWDAGAVTAIKTQVINGPITGVRFVSSSGAVTGRAVE